MTSDKLSFSLDGSPGEKQTLYLSGRLSIEYLDKMLSLIEELFREKRPAEIIVDLKDVTYMDSAGALFLLELEHRAANESIPVNLLNMSFKEKGILDLIDRQSLKEETILTEKRGQGIVEQIGYGAIDFLNDIKNVVSFTGTIIIKLFSSVFHLNTIRWGDVITCMKKTGVDGLPIVGLISFLLGLIMAFMSSLQLKQFGANMFVPSLVSIAMIKELGPIMTAIIVAGRSGSAFAAEIGTMKVNEEVDALITMGFDPVKFLAIPKVFAAMVVVPFLTIFSDLFAIFGGLVVGVLGLDLTIHTYIQQTMKAMKIFDIVTSLIKAVVFAVLIAGIGCQRGFEVKNSAEEVGSATTSAVVSSLFIIIVVDSMFAIVLSYLK
ncbi:MAG TPA: MlaE family lipid ABC transporter permease subunit [Syntrophorhabdaceae bacterium]|nr:MlaE family lipid ABC transporter permease subunit [Syntrophorhabdaceae bacterium]HOL05375.1 MlaE family lipid ABC transporter permease subunit [Syntrophorhabdaceae bacterium]HON85026.1 MlaE family lipid ABC transporter permease subunit [Syntrophorhabdaceae bacterium]HOT41555.1 MlaE family lipid ABC transporter permease subunit [Syntrophorhabdaceae bacterium]HPC65853.1 MlaE family lipid ABC transporter permease subunit [Syntrophorhabdaceae bacterium]